MSLKQGDLNYGQLLPLFEKCVLHYNRKWREYQVVVTYRTPAGKLEGLSESCLPYQDHVDNTVKRLHKRVESLVKGCKHED